ncbi:MAG: hypothetical protein OMM_07502 [Candidatus Magnetoglobus multicellularis str. Araruama]|uniref:Uncharacterized protein n=1 Tax=Candidatus Magnetoglobus multicellularis str. Araruama TaxID=890399 RepID=A0A1V1PC43_9BACT|nr:MAG: hypothetical protein OMM_07502 [Candidatus Magnetoglobus multicellularis str. Araruama]
MLTVVNKALRFTPPDSQLSQLTTARSSDRPGQHGDISDLKGSGRRDPIARMNKYTKQLNLSESQQEALKNVFQEMSQKMRTSRNTALPRGGMRAVREKRRKASQVAIMQILNPEQRDLFDEMIEQGQPKRGTLWQLDDTGQLKPIHVILGLSDSAHTEISGRGIVAGMQVIKGIE